MKNNILLLIMAIVFCMFCSCNEKMDKEGAGGTGPGGEAAIVKIETIDGIPHVYNTETPLKGEITLELEKLSEIDSLKIDPAQPPSFTQIAGTGDRTYLFDTLQFTLYIFDAEGKQLNRLQIKGQGPGEITQVSQYLLSPRDNDLWILSDNKAIRFNREGKYLDEIKFKKRYREISMLDENCFMGNYFILNPNESDEKKQRKLSCVMFDREENVLARYLEGEGLGGLTVVGQLPGGRFVRVVFVIPTIVPDIVYRVDRASRLIYVCKNMDYVIFSRNLKGEILRVIHREHKNKPLSEEDRKEVVDQQLYGQPPEFKKLLSDNLPPSFCAILSLHPLPHGYLAVYQIIGSQKFVVDIFDPEGRYIYRLKFPGEELNYRTRFYKETGHIGMVDSINDRDIYREYRVKNLKEIFGN